MIKIYEQRQEYVNGNWVDIDTFESEITYERFIASFVKERWDGETRHGYINTKYGRHQTMTITKNPYENRRTVRSFEFN